MEDDVEILEIVDTAGNRIPSTNSSLLKCPFCLDNGFRSFTGLNVHLDVVHGVGNQLSKSHQSNGEHFDQDDIKRMVDEIDIKCGSPKRPSANGLPGRRIPKPANGSINYSKPPSIEVQLSARRQEQQRKFQEGKSANDSSSQSPIRKKYETDEEMARRLVREEADFDTARLLQQEEIAKNSQVVILSDDIEEINGMGIEAGGTERANSSSLAQTPIFERIIDESVVSTLPEYNLVEERIRKRLFTDSDADPGSSCTFDVLKTIRVNVRQDRRVQDVYLCADCAHFASDSEDTGFSCGYRNAQILISCMYNFPNVRNQLVRKLGDMYVPSIEKMQRLIEKAWREGWDPQGAKEHNFSIHGSRRWIGPVDLYAMFMSLGIEVKIDYFVHEHSNHGPHPKLFEYAKKHFLPSSSVPVLPLYLQHSGHSQTVVGYELRQKQNDCNLLVFDPGVRSEKMRFTSGSETRWLDLTVRRPSSKLSKPSFEVLRITGRVLCPDEQARQKADTAFGIRGQRFVS